MTVLRCDVVDGVWWIAKQLEDGKKITPVEPVVVAFQGEDIRENPNFWQILPCPKCGVETDKGHDPLKHIDTHLLKHEIVAPRKDEDNERMESDAQAREQRRSGDRGACDEERREVFHERLLVSRGRIVDRRNLSGNGLARDLILPRWRGRVIFFFDTLLNVLEYLTKRATRIRFRLLSKGG